MIITIFREHCKEFVIPITLAISFILFRLLSIEIIKLKDEISVFVDMVNYESEFIKDATKLIGISYIRKIGCNLCLDFGYKTFADKIDICSRIVSALILIPKLSDFYVDIIRLL